MLGQDGDMRKIEVAVPKIVQRLSRPREPGEPGDDSGAVPSEKESRCPQPLGARRRDGRADEGAADLRGLEPGGDDQRLLGRVGIGGSRLETAKERGRAVAEKRGKEPAIRLEDELGYDAAFRRPWTTKLVHPRPHTSTISRIAVRRQGRSAPSPV